MIFVAFDLSLVYSRFLRSMKFFQVTFILSGLLPKGFPLCEETGLPLKGERRMRSKQNMKQLCLSQATEIPHLMLTSSTDYRFLKMNNQLFVYHLCDDLCTRCTMYTHCL